MQVSHEACWPTVFQDTSPYRTCPNKFNLKQHNAKREKKFCRKYTDYFHAHEN